MEELDRPCRPEVGVTCAYVGGFWGTHRLVSAVFHSSLTRYIFLLDDLCSLIFHDHRIVLGAGTALDHHASRPDHREVPDLVWQ